MRFSLFRPLSSRVGVWRRCFYDGPTFRIELSSPVLVKKLLHERGLAGTPNAEEKLRDLLQEEMASKQLSVPTALELMSDFEVRRYAEHKRLSPGSLENLRMKLLSLSLDPTLEKEPIDRGTSIVSEALHSENPVEPVPVEVELSALERALLEKKIHHPRGTRTPFLSDTTKLFDPRKLPSLQRRCKAIQKRGYDIVVVTLRAPLVEQLSTAECASQLFHHWKMGANGILIVADAWEEELGIMLGHGVKPPAQIPQDWIADIIFHANPYFKRGWVEGTTLVTLRVARELNVCFQWNSAFEFLNRQESDSG